MASFNRTVSRVVLPVAAFVLLVAGTTWVAQFLPSWRSESVNPAPAGPKAIAGDVLRFSRPETQFGPIRAVWEFDDKGEDTGYVLENEEKVDGHYDIPFRNVLGAPAELDFLATACDCSHAEVCILPHAQWQEIDAALTKKPWARITFANEPKWRIINRDNYASFKIPADGEGLLRIAWHGRKPPGEHLKINLRFGCRPEGDAQIRQIQEILVPVVMVPHVLFDPREQSIGVLGPGESKVAEFHFWSANQDELNVRFQPREDDPLFQFDTHKLNEAERRALQEKLNPPKESRHHVRAAYRVRVAVHERQGDKLMEQGPFARYVPVILDELPLEASATPQVTGTVRGEVEVGGVKDRGKIQLETFRSADDKVVTVTLHADPKAVIELVDPPVPACLKVVLKRNAKGSTAQRAQWELKLTVPAGQWTGPMPENASVYLRVLGTPPRMVRIPVTGNGTR
jgi:hypothetical protein